MRLKLSLLFYKKCKIDILKCKFYKNNISVWYNFYDSGGNM